MGMINRRNILLGSSLLPLAFVPRIVGAEEARINTTYAGKIIYSKQPIDPKSVNPAALATNFTSKDSIYGVAFFDKQIKDMTPPDAYVMYFRAVGNDPALKQQTVRTLVDDGNSFTELLRRQPEWRDATVLYLDVSPDPSDQKIYPLFASYSENFLMSFCHYVAEGAKYKLSLSTTVESLAGAFSGKTNVQAKGPLNIVLSKSDFGYHKRQQQIYYNRYYGDS
ncbi:hypothetical protein [Gloeobacter kilaueensis]|uniref:Uncharacterized protein n=1 Tax=Gloeobacter kilaueensis (strain ATCC BAA-2537 / CCAP 1431/1 / ULC 316 / JS1) TaxID=1183438 RepID=U5QJ81_GLOK1|nr:hypothetical protein [Gloeobacter kilaueensis]AGY58918.1 hypothetical protein GKIL_2672 [Gloeobacter kilaueensis JS1]